jgi:hypothetical protein
MEEEIAENISELACVNVIFFDDRIDGGEMALAKRALVVRK